MAHKRVDERFLIMGDVWIIDGLFDEYYSWTVVERKLWPAGSAHIATHDTACFRPPQQSEKSSLNIPNIPLKKSDRTDAHFNMENTKWVVSDGHFLYYHKVVLVIHAFGKKIYNLFLDFK